MRLTRWATVTAIAAVALLGAACSDDDDSADTTPTAAAATASVTAAATSAATSTATTATATASAAASPAAAGGAERAVISNFTLPSITVKTGAVVEFVNQDSAPHTATSDDKTTFDSKTLNPGGGSFKFTASKAGTFPYACSIHPTMKGTITVQ